MTDQVAEADFEDSGSLGASPGVARSPFVVMKFGGSSVSTAENWSTIAGLVRNRLAAGLKPVVVHSALQGVSDALAAVLEHAISAQPDDTLAAIRKQHEQLATDLGLDPSELIEDRLHELEQLVAGVRLVREVSVRVRVRMMALGELMSTRIGAAYLKSVGVPVEWMDARDVLQSELQPGVRDDRSYLSATCGIEPDPVLTAQLLERDSVVLTQGFIARNDRGETVLLGRGGSDTSAAYIAARLQARRLEVWSDVPGMFSADPRVAPAARLLLALDYDEAQELASAGSAVLHPRCLSPLRPHNIPLFIRSTLAPEISGTVIATVTEDAEPQVKGICVRDGIMLINMDSVGMWQEVGFLADVFQVFAELGVSIDLVSTSETNVTVSIDTADGMLDKNTQEALVQRLAPLCRVTIIEDCAAISLVGRKIRTFLARIAPALGVFEEERIHLMSQSANDLNLSFVVDTQQGERLVNKLHTSMIRKSGGSPSLGPSWERLFQAEQPGSSYGDTWWARRREQLLQMSEKQLNAYVYDSDTVRQAARSLRGLKSIDRVLYAMKANFNQPLLRALAEEGVDFECVSPGEVAWLEEAVSNVDPARILFTPNFAPREEYEWGFSKGLQVTLDNLYPLQAWPEVFSGQKIFVRIDPGKGRGHHDHVKTAGVHSKFGIPRFEADELERLAKAADAEIIGIHAHSGSGILEPDNWLNVAAELVAVAQRFPGVEAIDLGGGLGIPEKPGEKPFDLQAFDKGLAEFRAAWPQYKFWIEPGRYLVAQSGVLLTRVTQVKGKGDMRYVGVGTGMNSLIRPALYGSYHEIVNLTRLDEVGSETVTVVGPICETGDRLGTDRLLPPTVEGDVILIANAGAYGYVMSSNYNRRAVAEEIVI